MTSFIGFRRDVCEVLCEQDDVTETKLEATKPAKVHVSCVSPPLIAHSVSFVFIRVTCRSWMVFFTLVIS